MRQYEFIASTVAPDLVLGTEVYIIGDVELNGRCLNRFDTEQLKCHIIQTGTSKETVLV